MRKNECVAIFMAFSLSSCSYYSQFSVAETGQYKAMVDISQLKLDFQYSPRNAKLYIDNLQLFSQQGSPLITDSQGQLKASTYLSYGLHELRLVDKQKHEYLSNFSSGKHNSEVLHCTGTNQLKCSLT